MPRISNPYAMTAARKAKWIEAGIPGAERIKIVDGPDEDDPDDDDDPDDEDDPDEPTPQVPSVNYGPDGTGGPATLPGGSGDDLGQPSPTYGSGGPSNLPGIPGLGGSGAGGGLGTGISAGPTAGAGSGIDYTSGGGGTNVRLGSGLAGTGQGGGGLAGGGGGGGRGGGSRSFTTGQGGLPPSGYDFGPGGDVGGPGQGGGTPPQGGSGSFNTGGLGADRRERQEYLEDLKNYRTLDLPGEAVTGVNRLVENYNKAYGEARGANEARYQQLLGIADQTTGQRAADIRGEGVEERADLQQGLARTGLANTTVSPTLTVGSKRREQESLNRLADQMQGTKLGIIERREDQYPDSAALQSSLASLGQGYGGAGVSALYGALGNVQQGGLGSAVPAAQPAGAVQPAAAAGLPLNETGLAPAIPTLPSFGKQKGGDVFRTL